MRSSRGRSGAPSCESRDENGDLTVHHQWLARNVHGFVIHWYVCEYCGIVMHEEQTWRRPNANGIQYSRNYEFIPAYVIEEIPA